MNILLECNDIYLNYKDELKYTYRFFNECKIRDLIIVLYNNYNYG